MYRMYTLILYIKSHVLILFTPPQSILHYTHWEFIFCICKQSPNLKQKGLFLVIVSARWALCSAPPAFLDLDCWSTPILNKPEGRVWLFYVLAGNEWHYFLYFMTKQDSSPSPCPVPSVFALSHTCPPPAHNFAFGRSYLNSLGQYGLLKAEEKLICLCFCTGLSSVLPVDIHPEPDLELGSLLM